MGWSARYKFKGKVKNGSNSTPWFIPGYGTRPLSATFSIIYTLPLNKDKKEKVNPAENGSVPADPAVVPDEKTGTTTEGDNTAEGTGSMAPDRSAVAD